MPRLDPVGSGAAADPSAQGLHDDLGDELPLAGPPSTIVSLVPSLSELVATWGLGSQLVGVTDFCVAPADGFPAAERIRGTKNPDTARIIELRPDLVLADQEENRRLDVERLRAAGVAVWVTSVRSVRDVAASIRRLGPALGRPDEGAELADRILAAVAIAEDPPAAGLPAACMIWRDGPHRGADEQWWTVGPETFAGDLMRCAGLRPVTPGEDRRYPRAELAAIRAAEPRIILLPDEPYDFGAEDAAVFADWGADVIRCSGQPLFWWGPRTPDALRWLGDLRGRD